MTLGPRLWTLLLTGLAATAAGAEPVRLLLALGSNVGGPDEAPLRYAETDARRFRDVMVELGQVLSSRAVLLERPSAPEVRRALAELTGRAVELSARGDEVLLIVYVSAHARKGAIHLGGTELGLGELRALAGAVKAPLRLLVIDTCDSGVAVRRKGGVLAPGYELNLERLPLRGEVLISSSGPAEASEEWDSLGGSLFTHHLLTGLRGDADEQEDGRVTLSEAYAYTYRRTVASAARSQQHPAADIDLSGTGELVLTELKPMKTGIDFAPALQGSYLVVSQPEAHVVLEVDKRAGKALRLAVPPGRYLIRKRLGAQVGLLSIELPYGGQGRVDESKMDVRSYTEVALKGGAVDLKASMVMASVAYHSALVPETGGRARAGIGYRHSFGSTFAAGTVSVGRAAYRGVGLTIVEDSLLTELAVGVRTLRWAVIPYLGAGLRWWLVQQRFARDAEPGIQRSYPGNVLEPRLVHGFGPAVFVGAEVPLSHSFLALIQLGGELRHLPTSDAAEWSLGATASAMVGWRF